MRRRRPVRRRSLYVALAAVLLVGTLVTAAPVPQPARAGAEAVPDLAMAPLSDFRVQWVDGRRLLRFTAMMVNVGDGPFEVRGRRSSTSDPMAVRQVIYETSSPTSDFRTFRTDAVAKYAGDGHNHWHVQEMMRYDLWGNGKILRGAKVGFCFLDSDPWRLSLAGAPSGPYYRGSWCGTNPQALQNRMGISVGWGDEYTADLAYQWVDITNVPTGTYYLRAKVDPYGFFLEKRETNQCAYVKLRITSSGATLKESARRCANDWSSNQFATEIAWMFDTGITTGCAFELYCPSDLVPRAQMAAFLERAFDLGPASRDYFTDDNGHVHERSINRLAEAEITTGCSSTRFCPGRLVTRGQMAAFIARAMNLPAATRDYFTDDRSSPHEADINRIAEAGITTGCGGTNYCPGGHVTRAQMAAFLHRALTGG